MKRRQISISMAAPITSTDDQIRRFFRLNATPTESSLQEFAESIGYTVKQLEAQAYQMLSACLDREYHLDILG